MTTYKEAGVDIESTDALVEDISSLSQTTARSGIYEGIGGFGGIFDLKKCGYDDPLLVSGTDGIGTKILLGIETDILDGLGHVAEGVYTAKEVSKRASLLNIDMPITNEVNNVLFHEKPAKEAVLDLIQRPITQE